MPSEWEQEGKWRRGRKWKHDLVILERTLLHRTGEAISVGGEKKTKISQLERGD